MKAYLQSTGHTWIMEIAKLDPIDSKSTDAQVAHYIGWMKVNDSIIGSVNLHLSDALCQCFEGSAHRVLSLVQNMQTLGQFFEPL